MITRNNFKHTLLIIMPLITQALYCKNGLTYDITGRLGDNIMTYCQHKWLACNHSLELYVPDFKFKEFFGLAATEKHCSAMKQYRGRITLNNEAELSSSIDQYLYNSSYYMRLNSVSNNDELGDFLFKKSIENPIYGAEIQRGLFLRGINFSFQLPSDKITVAIHIRKGCDFDFPLFSKQYAKDTHHLAYDKTYSDRHHCLKFPPEQFYAEQLKKLYAYLGNKPLYVQVFSDASSPEEIIDRLQAYLGKKYDITFVTKKSDFLHFSSILSDIYAMSKFDYLVRSESHFPWIAQMIGNHKGIIRPVAFAWADNYLKITQTLLDIPDRAANVVKTVEF